MNQLRELVRQYAANEVDFLEFRRSMVVRFLSVRNGSPSLENAANAIDAECSDFSENLIDEDQLKRNLVSKVQPSQTTSAFGAVLFVPNYDVSSDFSALEAPIAASGTFSSSSAQSPASGELVAAA